MGLSIVAAADACGRRGTTHPTGRVLALGAATVAVAMLTPSSARGAGAGRPARPDWSGTFSPVPGRTNFTLLPWSGFVTAGALVGLVLCSALADPRRDRRADCRHGRRPDVLTRRGRLRGVVPAGRCTRTTNFWTSSPTFFFLRTGSCCIGVGVAWAWAQRPGVPGGWSPLVLLGVESLFVYWIHVEMVYGLLTSPLHRQLPLPWVAAAFAAFTLLMLGRGRSQAPRQATGGGRGRRRSAKA